MGYSTHSGEGESEFSSAIRIEHAIERVIAIRMANRHFLDILACLSSAAGLSGKQCSWEWRQDFASIPNFTRPIELHISPPTALNDGKIAATVHEVREFQHCIPVSIFVNVID